MKIVKVEMPETKSILSKLFIDPPIILVGSAISGWKPTLLPIGKSFTKGMFDLLFPSHFLGNNIHLIDSLNFLYRKVPFEHLLDKCPNHQKITQIIKRAFEVNKYNPVHKAIAETFIGNKLLGLITTNYDLCLDKLLVGKKKIKRVITENDFQSLDITKEKIYFKIHGSADDVKGETLVWALRHESCLPDWKRKLLLSMIKEKNLLIIGYSGLDFEICPEILKMPIKQVFWNIRNENQMSSNAHQFLKKMPGYFLVGDMQILLSFIIGQNLCAKWGESSNDLLDSIRTEITGCEIGIWRASLLNSIGCASIALKASKETLRRCSIDKIDKTDLVSLRRQKAQALFHSGKYCQSAKEFYKTSKETDLKPSLRVTFLLDSCDAYRCYGAFLRAFIYLKKAKKELYSIVDLKKFRELEGVSALKEVLILRHLYQITKAIKIQFISNYIRKISTNLLRVSSKISLETGNWFDFQQARHWAERMDIDPKVLAYQIPYEPPPTKEGYDHLGYYIAQSMSFRDQLSKGKGYFSMEEKQNIKFHIKNCMVFGNYPELWKLAFIVLKRSSNKKEYLKIFLKYFFSCEYTIKMRIYQLISGG